VKPGEEDTKAVELVLIRRRGSGEEAGHHGGVWKIAYADFMTAMMAFFLVMWLINSTDQKVLTQVANYFNPMRLTDVTPREKGLQDIESGDQGKQGKESMPVDANEKKKSKQPPQERRQENSPPSVEGAKDNKEAGAPGKMAGASGKARYTEQALFSDPYGVLARIAADATVEASPKDEARDANPYRDPFDPTGQLYVSVDRTAAPKAQPKRDGSVAAGPTEAATQAPAQGGGPVDAKALDAKQTHTRMARDAKDADQAAQAAKEGLNEHEQVAAREAIDADQAAQAAKEDQNERKQAAVRDAMRALEQAAAAKAGEEKAAATAEATAIASDLKQMVAQLQGKVPSIDVTVTDEGVLISLTDDTDFGMFAIASAEPRPAMVVTMERIAKIVQTHRHPLIVRGHTDGRPYRSGTYDNWRLSTARAHMAYYMLVRGGVDETRFERVEGYADRSLRIPTDPEAAQNRRIEILLRRPRG
jgi:chemotaxis protein MotB